MKFRTNPLTTNQHIGVRIRGNSESIAELILALGSPANIVDTHSGFFRHIG
jgi:hypothetical protein